MGGVNLKAHDRATLRGGTFDPAQCDVIGRRFFIGATFDF